MAYDIRYAQYIDHTVLKPDTTRATLRRFCDEARKYGFASVCVNPCNVPFVVKELAGTPVKTAAVVGFPLGANTTHIKAEEAREAVANGAREIDMVINIAALKEGELDYVREDIRAVVEASHPEALVKVILEISALTDEEIATGCRLTVDAGADFVKTSTGYGSGGATIEAVKLMKSVVGDRCLVKASTGINNRAICDAFLAAGAVRFGTSKGIKIVEDIE